MLTRYPLRRGTAVPVLLEYADAEGDRSMRQVMPLAVITDDVRRSSSSTYLQARCSIAKASRTFRFDRVETLSDAKTGETFNVHEWLADLQLGEGRPFSWSDETSVDGREEARAPATGGRGALSWRLVILIFVIGYTAGRMRVIAAILHQFHLHHGLWL